MPASSSQCLWTLHSSCPDEFECGCYCHELALSRVTLDMTAPAPKQETDIEELAERAVEKMFAEED